MANVTASIILAVFGVILFAYIYVADLKVVLRQGRFMSSQIGKTSALIAILGTLSFVLVNKMPPQGLLHNTELLFFFSLVLAGLTSYIWSLYIRSIDIYEPERLRYIILTFVLACFTVFLVFPISRLINSQGFVLNGDGLNDFLYSVSTIGTVEEVVKIIPVLILLIFSSQINEPIDFIVYGSISALGFAFIENILYLSDTKLMALSGRLL